MKENNKCEAVVEHNQIIQKNMPLRTECSVAEHTFTALGGVDDLWCYNIFTHVNVGL